jgi:hypothetical protein
VRNTSDSGGRFESLRHAEANPLPADSTFMPSNICNCE